MTAQYAAGIEVREQHCNRREADQHQQADDANGNVALGTGENLRIVGAAGP
jgi:hypothetical protein